MICSRCPSKLDVARYLVRGMYICTSCAQAMTARFDMVLDALDGLNVADADVLLEAVRVHWRITSGPTTRREAESLLGVGTLSATAPPWKQADDQLLDRVIDRASREELQLAIWMER